MRKVRKVVIACMLMGVAVLGLYGCGNDATATPVPAPTDTVAVATATTEPAAPTATTAAAVGATATIGTGGDTGGVGTGTGLTGPAADLLNKSQQAMKEVNTFHYTMELASTDGSTNVTAEGDFEKPDKVRISMKSMTGTVGTIEMVIVGNDTYMKQPGSEQYISLGSAGTGLMNLGSLSNPSETSSVAQFADSADIAGDETVDGVDTTHVTFTYDVDKAMQAAEQQTGGTTALATPTGMKAKGDMWITKDKNYIYKMKFVTAAPDSSMQAKPVPGTTESTVTITYSKYNEAVSPPIEKPENVITMPENVVGTPVP